MSRRPRHRDSRPSWDAPFLPCIRDYHMSNGERKTEVDADYERRYREHCLTTFHLPTFRFDPTYDLKRKPRA